MRGTKAKYSKELADEFLRRITEEGRSSLSVSKDDDMPSYPTIAKWRLEYADFDRAYKIAIEVLSERYAWECVEISDASEADEPEVDETGKPFVNYAKLNRHKLMIDTRKWIATKFYPRMFGEKVQQEITGKDGASLVTPVIELVVGDGGYKDKVDS